MDTIDLCFHENQGLSGLLLSFKPVCEIMKKILIILALAILAVSAVLSEYPETPSTPAVSDKENTEETIKVSGAFALYPLTVIWADEYTRLHPNVRIDISAGGAGKGMTDVLGGLVDIGMVSRDINSAEEVKGAYAIAVTKDAVVPIINRNNPVYDDIVKKGINQTMFAKMYTDGTVKTWGELVGRPEVKDEIHVYTRSDASGSADTWAKYVGVKTQYSLRGIGVNADPGLLTAVQKDTLGVGYSNFNYAFDRKTGHPITGLCVVSFDVNNNGVVDPVEDISTKSKTVESIKAKTFSHPPARVEFFVTKSKPDGATADFIGWILTDGQKYVDGAGYVELPENMLDSELDKVR